MNMHVLCESGKQLAPEYSNLLRKYICYARHSLGIILVCAFHITGKTSFF